MFYRSEDGHGLPHNPFNAIVSPRPIGWISTRASWGDNLAPYSFFNAVAYVPPQVMFASNGAKDTVEAARATGVFCVNIVGLADAQRMNATSAALPRGTDEFDVAGIARIECDTIPCPRVAGAPASLECRVTQIVQLAGATNFVVFGEVTGVHLRDDCMADGRFDVTLFQPIARLGYMDYATVTDIWPMPRPGEA